MPGGAHGRIVRLPSSGVIRSACVPQTGPVSPRLTVLLVAAALAVPASPALAHQADPRIVTVIDEIAPALPVEVVVQVQAGIATQLVASNPTATSLEILDTAGRPFLRLSSSGVFADLETEEFFTTSNPNGAVPPGSGGGGPPRWVQISAGSSWGWYDHRLHPGLIRTPADPTRSARLVEFEVPVRLGDRRSDVRGHVQFQPLLGNFQVAADPAPPGLMVQALPGKLPGVFLANPGRLPVTVLGRDGEPFLRFSAAGVEVNERSRTHVEDRQARGVPAGPPQPEPAFRLVDPGGSTYTWLDSRLRYPDDLPPEPALRAATPTVLQQWVVPVQLAGAPNRLTGEVSWVPTAAAGSAAARSADAGAADAGAAEQDPDGAGWLLPVGIGLAALAVVGAAVLVWRRRA